jgi:hypothetical protein
MIVIMVQHVVEPFTLPLSRKHFPSLTDGKKAPRCRFPQGKVSYAAVVAKTALGELAVGEEMGRAEAQTKRGRKQRDKRRAQGSVRGPQLDNISDPVF